MVGAVIVAWRGRDRDGCRASVVVGRRQLQGICGCRAPAVEGRLWLYGGGCCSASVVAGQRWLHGRRWLHRPLVNGKIIYILSERRMLCTSRRC